MKNQTLNLTILISLSLLFLSLNSILCKMALANNQIDAYSFTAIRLLSGAFTLVFLLYLKYKTLPLKREDNWLSSFMLFLYAITFSYAYINLDAGLGALVLFGVVQITIILASFLQKTKHNFFTIVGVAIAFFGLVYLLYPKESFELSLIHMFLMMLSGFAWGIYTILGKNSKNPLLSTTDNFVKSTIFIALFLPILTISNVLDITIKSEGVFLAVLSGALTSAIGYVVWYFVVSKIEMLSAGVLQLLVPIIAIFLSVLILDEALTKELLISTTIVLSGVLISLYSKKS